MHSSHGPAARLLTKLQSIATLSQADKEAVLALPIRVQTVKADQELVREGDKPTQSILLLDGFMCRYKFTETGKRQIFAFHTPGDMPDVLTLHLKTMDHSVGTISRCEVGFVQHDTLRALFEVRPGLMDVFWRDTLVDAAIFREWMLGIGRRSAKTRIAHLTGEMFMRLKAVGLEEDNVVPLPITQVEVADALGLSNVHVNRTVQELREDGLFRWENGMFKVLDWERLKEVAEFDPTYLHQDSRIAA